MATKNIYALDIGSWSLKVARGRREKAGGITVDLYDEIRYGVGKVEDEAAEGDLSGLRGAVAEFSKRYTLEPADDLCLSVCGTDVFSRFIKLPPVSDSIDKIIQYEARQQIPFDMDQVVWDYQPVKEGHEPWEEINVGLFALKNEKVDELMTLFEPWRKNLRIIQQAPLAIYNFLCFEGYDSESVAAIDIGEKSTGILAINPPGYWLRSLRVGGEAITERIQSHFGVSRREAERIKERSGESGHAAQLMRVMAKPLGNILSEIQRSLGYYKSIEPDVEFSKIIGLGNTFRMKGMDRVISEGLQNKVGILKGTNNLTLTKEARRSIGSGIGGCCVLFGLIVQCSGEGRIRVNMVPQGLSFENEMRRKKPYLAGAAVGIVAVIVLLILGEFSYNRRVVAQQDFGAGVVSEVEELSREHSRALNEVQSLEGELAKMTERGAGPEVFLHAVSEIHRVLPETELPEEGAAMPSGVIVSDIKFRWVPEADYGRRMRSDVGGLGDFSGPGAGAVTGKDTVLVAEISCESTVFYYSRREFHDEVIEIYDEERTESYYSELIENFRQHTFRNDEEDRKVFRDVYLVGELEPESYDIAQLGIETLPEGEEPEVIRFRILAGINGPGLQEQERR